MDDLRAFNPYLPPRSDSGEIANAASGLTASRTDRFSAWLADWLLLWLALMLGGLLSSLLLSPSGFTFAAYLPVTALLAANFWLLFREGQTVGKWNRGIRMVRTDGSRAGVWRIIVLRIAAPSAIVAAPMILGLPLLSLLLFLADALFILGKSSRCLHDRMADTKVVNA